DLLEFLPFAEQFTNAAVSPVRTDAGGDDVANPRQAEERVQLGAVSHAKTDQLDKRPSQERGFRVVPEAKPVTDARGDADDILERAGEFDSHQVGVGINAEAIAVEKLLHVTCEIRIGARRHQGRRQSTAYFFGVTGATKRSDRPLAENLADD